MFKFDENYYYRKCFFEREPQVPTQSQIKKKMGEPLANVYFKSMTPKLKVLAGLEPVMKGGGANWYMPPHEILKSRHVLKPIRKEHLSKLSYIGIDGYAERMHEEHFQNMEKEKKRALEKSDEQWKVRIKSACEDQWQDEAKDAEKKNTAMIQQAFHEFTMLYSTSINKIESLLFQAAEAEIKRTREAAFEKMQAHYESLLKQQATMLYDRYAKKLEKKKSELKDQFLKKINKANDDTWKRIHDINVEKHVAIEKLRHLLECQNLACQVYVALKEREECAKEMESAKHKHEKKVKRLDDNIVMKDVKIALAAAKEKKVREFDRIWQKKVCHTVKKFQIFVSYCLNSLPEYAEFFINIEKLMMIQLEEVMQNPSAESLFEEEMEKLWTPVARPHPFYLCCEKGYKPKIDKDLCPVHCTASAEQFPVVIINKRCIYAACDNFNLFTSKIKDFVEGERGDDADFVDDHDYTYDVPVRYTSLTHLRALQLESSLMQILQKERPNVKGVPTACCVCRLPYCFCSPIKIRSPKPENVIKKTPSIHSIPSGNKIKSREVELKHEREPKWESYMDFVKPKRCECAKLAKHHLQEHLPAYMRITSPYDAPDLPNYEPCDLDTLKRLVRKAQGKRKPPPPLAKVPSKTKNVGTQYSDQEFDKLCTCFSDEELDKLFHEILNSPQGKAKDRFAVVDGSVSDTNKDPQIFAAARAFSLRNLLEGAPQLEEIFKKPTCSWSQD
ncbi:uncharacterized protein LOC133527544 [Cydia pomonella]|uniref:uncharacterized protein LOC133527544 n=1 Tax=Cydia pomonella TaxID=82600 RepID=UPI002ADDE08C|nr:uncharacterized protein LOC133527544 [Cydia pomonella]